MGWAGARTTWVTAAAAGLGLSAALALALAAPRLRAPAPPPAPAPAPAPVAAPVEVKPAPVVEAAPVEQPRRADAAVRGRVLDQDGKPVASAYVRVEGPGEGEADEGPVDAEGRFALGRGAGPVRLTVEADDYVPRQLDAEAPGEVAVALTALATLDVSVLGAEGVLSDADVVAERDGEVAPAASDDEGVAELSLAPGRYLVRARHPGYRARPSVAVELRPGERVTVEITLERAAPGEEAVVDTRDRAAPASDESEATETEARWE